MKKWPRPNSCVAFHRAAEESGGGGGAARLRPPPRTQTKRARDKKQRQSRRRDTTHQTNSPRAHRGGGIGGPPPTLNEILRSAACSANPVLTPPQVAPSRSWAMGCWVAGRRPGPGGVHLYTAAGLPLWVPPSYEGLSPVGVGAQHGPTAFAVEPLRGHLGSFQLRETVCRASTIPLVLATGGPTWNLHFFSVFFHVFHFFGFFLFFFFRAIFNICWKYFFRLPDPPRIPLFAPIFPVVIVFFLIWLMNCTTIA